MAKIWHKVIGDDGFAIYRASASRTYASYNKATGSFSSKMLPGNVPVEVLAKAPKTIRVKGAAWGTEVVRSYLEGEKPVVAVIAYRGIGERDDFDAFCKATGKTTATLEELRAYRKPADPTAVSFNHYSHTSIESARESMKYYEKGIEEGREFNAVMIVELR